MLRSLSLFLLYLFNSYASYSQPQFEKVYPIAARATDIEKTIDSNYIVLGEIDASYNDTFVLIKIDKNGEILWSKKYYDSVHCEATDIIETPDSGFAVAAGILFRFDKNGDLLWQNEKYNCPVYYVKMDTNDGFIACGHTLIKGVIVKYDYNGNIDWAHKDWYFVNGVHRLSNGNYLFAIGYYDGFHLVEMNTEEDIINDNLVADMEVQSITPLSDTTFLFTGISTNSALRIIITNTTGDIKLDRQYFNIYHSYQEEFLSSAIFKDGNYYIVTNIPYQWGNRGILFKIDSTGVPGFARYYKYNGELRNLTESFDGGFLLAGWVHMTYDSDMQLIKTNILGKTH
ncbi:MAG: hypothetical protein ABIQ74_06680 [Chitinophagales bacterium]